MQEAENSGLGTQEHKRKTEQSLCLDFINKTFVPENFLISRVDRWPLLHVEVVCFDAICNSALRVRINPQ